MKYAVLDAETNILNTGEGAVGGHQASPFSPRNRIVALGELRPSRERQQLDYAPEGLTSLSNPPMALLEAASGTDILLVGHNLPFDLAYLYKTWTELFEAAQPHLFIWDTQQVAYLLSAQQKMYASLDDECLERGLPLKDGQVKAYWDQGIDTEFIPPELLLPYLEDDLTNTQAVFLSQWEEAKQDPLLLELIRVKMDDKLMTTMMTIHGMEFDLALAAEKIVELDKVIATTVESITELIVPLDLPFEFNPGSGDHLSLALFGGPYKVVVDDPQFDDHGNPILYKGGARAGQQKTKKAQKTLHHPGFGLKPGDIPQLKNGSYSTDDEYLSKVKHPLAKLISVFREADKDVSTYYRGYSQLVFPDNKLHPDFNHESTATGRQSCSKPNLQNVSKDDED